MTISNETLYDYIKILEDKVASLEKKYAAIVKTLLAEDYKAVNELRNPKPEEHLS